MPSIGQKLRDEFLKPSSTYLPQLQKLRLFQDENLKREYHTKSNTGAGSSILQKIILNELVQKDATENVVTSSDSLFTRASTDKSSKYQNTVIYPRKARHSSYKIKHCISPKRSQNYNNLRLLQKKVSNGIAIQASLNSSCSFLDRACGRDVDIQNSSYLHKSAIMDPKNIFKEISLTKYLEQDENANLQSKQQYSRFRDYVSKRIKEQKRNKSFVEIDANILQDLLTENILLKERILKSKKLTFKEQFIDTENYYSKLCDCRQNKHTVLADTKDLIIPKHNENKIKKYNPHKKSTQNAHYLLPGNEIDHNMQPLMLVTSKEIKRLMKHSYVVDKEILKLNRKRRADFTTMNKCKERTQRTKHDTNGKLPDQFFSIPKQKDHDKRYPVYVPINSSIIIYE